MGWVWSGGGNFAPGMLGSVARGDTDRHRHPQAGCSAPPPHPRVLGGVSSVLSEEQEQERLQLRDLGSHRTQDKVRTLGAQDGAGRRRTCTGRIHRPAGQSPCDLRLAVPKHYYLTTNNY
jgi:hypothetical protein